MTARRGTAGAQTPAGAQNLGSVKARTRFSTNDELSQRRARREEAALLAELRCLLEALDAGLIDLAQFACTSGLVTGRLADIALSGAMI